jgi:hypothetical protein
MSALDHKKYMVRGSQGTMMWYDDLQPALDMQEKCGGVVYELLNTARLQLARMELERDKIREKGVIKQPIEATGKEGSDSNAKE